MKYFIDTEFLEGTQKRRIGNIELPKYFNTKNIIDLISIGIVAENGTEYYAISKDFNLKEAWNRWEQRTGEGDRNNINPRLYWIRENVLKNIYEELFTFEVNLIVQTCEINLKYGLNEHYKTPKYLNKFSYKSLKYLINKYGKTNKQIAEDIKAFIDLKEAAPIRHYKPEFYGYYSDYDWVAFCWLFGKMIDLPKGFPMYCIDLKQTLCEKELWWRNLAVNELEQKQGILLPLTSFKKYPKQTNEHNALADARWNFELYKFLNTL